METNMKLTKVLRGTARAILLGFMFFAFLMPPLALFNPLVLMQLFELLNLPVIKNERNVFVLLPPLFLLAGILSWWLLEGISRALERSKSG